ncbi:hypothetical protein GCM10028816_50700 [Spirosoma lituiforme]
MRGLGVFGQSLGIHGGDSLGVYGDLVLVHAEVVGEGVLVLKSRHPQHIVSNHSTLSNLALKNPTRVDLQGELRVKQSLTVDQGVFAVSATQLEMDLGSQLRLLRGAQLTNQPTYTLQDTQSKTRLTNTERLAGLNATGAHSLFGYFIKPQPKPGYNASGYRLIEATPIDPPPKLDSTW